MHTVRRSFIFAVVFLLLIGVLAPFAWSYAADVVPIQLGTAGTAGLPPGCRQATGAEQQLVGKSVICPGDDKLLFGGCDYNPYPILERYKTNSRAYITPHQNSEDNLESGIDSALACRLTKLLQAAAQYGCYPRIESAYRSAKHQESICGLAGRSGCAKPGRSCHQYGLAVDLTTDCGGWLRKVAPQFQLHFPYSGIHVQCIEHRTASVSSCNRACNGGLPINPDLSNIPPPGGAPSSGISNAVRSAVSPSPVSQQITPTTATQPAQQTTQPPPPLGTENKTPYPAGTCAPQFYCMNNNLYYRASTCVDQVNKVCEDGCSGTACIGSTGQVSSALADALAQSTSTGTTGALTTDEGSGSAGGSSEKLSVFEQISLIANPEAVGSATGSEPFVLVVGDEEAARLQEREQRSAELPPGTIYTVQPTTYQQQTFTSGDLSQSPGTYLPQQSSGFQRTLETMKETLLNALAYLRPFGRPIDPNVHLISE